MLSPDSLRELIRRGETLAVEFKGESRAPLADQDLIEAVVCLANRDREPVGWLLIGVEDDGAVTGARARHRDGIDPMRVAALITNRTRPPLSVRVEVVPLDGKTVLAIEVPRAETAITTSDGKALRRTILGTGKPGCLPMSTAEWLSREVNLGNLYRRLGAKAAYVRTRGFEHEQQRQMVLQYVKKHKRITRREAAELCQVSGSQAYHLLQNLVREGLLEPARDETGQPLPKRRAAYVKASPGEA